MMGRCSCSLLDDGKMFLFLLDDGKMLLILLEDVKVFPILAEEGTNPLFFLMTGCEGYLASARGTER